MGIFRKMMGYDDSDKVIKSANRKILASERMEFADNGNIKDFAKLADKIMYGYPLLVNFEGMNIEDANKLLSFLSGVVYGVGGKYFAVKEKIYLFSNAESLEDKSLEEFVFNTRSR